VKIEYLRYSALLISNPDEPEITNYKHQITNKFQISISKSQIRSNANCLGFWISVIVICTSTWLRVVRWWACRTIWYLCFVIWNFFYWNPNTETFIFWQHVVRKRPSRT